MQDDKQDGPSGEYVTKEREMMFKETDAKKLADNLNDDDSHESEDVNNDEQVKDQHQDHTDKLKDDVDDDIHQQKGSEESKELSYDRPKFKDAPKDFVKSQELKKQAGEKFVKKEWDEVG